MTRWTAVQVRSFAVTLCCVLLAGCAHNAGEPRELDGAALEEADALNARCNRLYHGLAAPYRFTATEGRDFSDAAERMRRDGSPLFRILAVPDGVLSGARGDKEERLAYTNALRDNAIRETGDEWCGIFLPDYLPAMLVANRQPVPGSPLEKEFAASGDDSFHWYTWDRLVGSVSALSAASGSSAPSEGE